MRLFFAMMGVCAVFAGDAWAACDKPSGTGAEGEIIYNRKWKVMQFCDGDKWIGMGAANTGAAVGGDGAVQLDDGTGGLKSGSGLYWDSGASQLHIPSVYLGSTGDFTTHDSARFNVTNGRTIPATVAMPQYGFKFPTTPMSAEAWISGHAGVTLFTAGVERARITGTGEMGIGTSVPDSMLAIHDAASGNAGAYLTSSAGTHKAKIGVADGTRRYFNHGGGLEILTNTNSPISFGVNKSGSATPDLFIGTNGFLGVGTASPADKLHVHGGYVRVSGTSNGAANVAYVSFAAANGARMGYVGDGTGANADIHVASDTGNVLAWGIGGNCIVNTGACASDARLKQDVAGVGPVLDKLDGIRGVSYRWKAHPDEVYYGVIAQEVQAVFPDLVNEDADTGMLAVNYNGLVAPLIEAVKELKAQNDDLRTEIDEIKALLGKKAAGDL